MNPAPPLDLLQRQLGHTFADPSLLALALTHPSHAHESGQTRLDNQRLEFLGDAVLQLVLTELLYRHDQKLTEGQMTKLRAALVNRAALATQARRFNLGDFLRIGRGEDRNGGRQRESNLADAFEAIVGAVYLDAGYAATQAWLLPLLTDACTAEIAKGYEANPKGLLQELLQSRQLGSPTYDVLDASGPDHLRHYTVAVRSAGEILAQGTGPNKKAAETAAALEALRKLKTNPA
ncbi:MAG: ribonuclease III [Verrucomicrobiia bacterium]